VRGFAAPRPDHWANRGSRYSTSNLLEAVSSRAVCRDRLVEAPVGNLDHNALFRFGRPSRRPAERPVAHAEVKSLCGRARFRLGAGRR